MSAPAFYVYLLCRPDGTPCYVGKGKGNRWVRHERRGRHPNRHLQNIIAKAKSAGAQLPKRKLAEGLTEAEAFALEIETIARIGREANGGPLVNLTDGGDGPSGYVPTVELRAVWSAQRRGRTLTPEWRENVSRALKGAPKSPEHAAKAAAAQRGKKRATGWWSTEEGRAKQRANNKSVFKKGHQPSAETRAKLREKAASYWAKRKSNEIGAVP